MQTFQIVALHSDFFSLVFFSRFLRALIRTLASCLSVTPSAIHVGNSLEIIIICMGSQIALVLDNQGFTYFNIENFE